MGLDMYAYRVDQITGEAEEIFYWRKHHDLHRWMEALYRKRGGVATFNLVAIPLDSKDLDDLEHDIKTGRINTPCWYEGKDLDFIELSRTHLKNGFLISYDSWW